MANRTAIRQTNRKTFTLLFGLALVLPFSGCYTSDQEVIPANAAEATPYKSDVVSLGEDGDMHLHRSPGSQGYTFTQTKKGDSSVKTGTLRAFAVKKGIYAVQIKYDDENSYDIAFCRLTSTKFVVMDPKPDAAVEKLADRYHVTTKLLNGLSGNPADILSFLRALKDVQFEKVKESN